MSAARCKAAATLLQRFPPRRSRNDAQLVLSLCDDAFDGNGDDGERLAFLDALVSTVDLQVRPVPCPRSQGLLAQGGEHVCFPTEYNRDGDCYRCVHCNQYVRLATGDDDEDDGAAAAAAATPVGVPTGYIRQLESIGNNLFAEYTAQYYSREAKSNVIVWSNGAGNCSSSHIASKGDAGEDVFPLGVAVLIFHKQGLEEAGGGGGTWASTHVASVTLRPQQQRLEQRLEQQLEYTLHTSVYLDAAAKPQAEPHGTAASSSSSSTKSSTRFNGFLSQPSKAFTAPVRHSKGGGGSARGDELPDGESIMADLGERIQQAENAIRGRIDELYFAQAGHIVSRLRTGGNKRAAKAAGAEDEVAVPVASLNASKKRILTEEATPEPAASTPAAAEARAAAAAAEVASPTDVTSKPKKKKKAPKAAWAPYQDEEGNTYYYNDATGETSWDVPADLQGGDASEAALPAAVAEEEAAPAPEPATAVPAVLEILASLNLSKDTAENYFAALRKHCKATGSKLTPARLVALADEQLEAEEAGAEPRAVLEALVPAFGDRKKIMTWIRSQQ